MNSIKVILLILAQLTVSLANKRTNRTASPMPLVARDEFNVTETPLLSANGITSLDQQHLSIDQIHPTNSDHSKRPTALRQVLLRINFDDCCPSFKNLTQMQEIHDEQKRLHGKSRSLLKPIELLNELRYAFANITYLSIDGQSGDNELERYYKFYDDIQFYLKLLKVSHDFLKEPQQQQQPRSSSSDSSSLLSTSEDHDFRRHFKRDLKTIEFRAIQDPILSSFLNELLIHEHQNTTKLNPNFELYEDFIKYTQFGHYYARNISTIRETIQVFDRICSHLERLSFPSNLTRPSKQYEMIRTLSRELFLIRSELFKHVSLRILKNRPDVKRVLARLDELIRFKPYIRMLGDEFGAGAPYFSGNVRKLSHLLDLYTRNSLTQLSFYDQLAELPEDFILLGSTIAHEYETKEVPQYSRFDSDYFSWHYSGGRHDLDSSSSMNDNNKRNASSSQLNDARQSNQSLLSKLFS